MDKSEYIISINKSYFTENEKVYIDEFGGCLKAALFKYNSGVCGLKLANKNGYIVVLPFNGQQIWDAIFNNRNLKMKSSFTAPVNTNNFYHTYGCLFMHCGALRVGSPDSNDFFFHGELPVAEYDDVKILIGRDCKGSYIGVTGTYTYNKSFGYHYCAKPLIKLYKDSDVMDISIAITNLSNYPMEMMYLAHINFLPVNNAEIVQSMSWNNKEMILRNAVYPDLESDNIQKDFIKKMSVDPSLSKIIKLNDPYNPPIIFYLNKPETDGSGSAHFMQIHPDGSADYVGYIPEELNYACRWIVINKDFKVISIVNPATCQAEGYLKEKEEGHIVILEEKNSKKFNLKIGYLNINETLDMKRKIDKITRS